jgi:hypothetical protein
MTVLAVLLMAMGGLLAFAGMLALQLGHPDTDQNPLSARRWMDSFLGSPAALLRGIRLAWTDKHSDLRPVLWIFLTGLALLLVGLVIWKSS